MQKRNEKKEASEMKYYESKTFVSDEWVGLRYKLSSVKYYESALVGLRYLQLMFWRLNFVFILFDSFFVLYYLYIGLS
jgi:hypothetical protein